MSVWLGAIGIALALFALVLATVANRRWASAGARKASEKVAPEAAISALTARVADLEAGAAGAAESSRTALRHVALVRYDAFGDVGGRLSYSAALLDDTGSGLVVTALAGKADVRTYLKTVSGGQGDQSLTPEEEQAVSAAVGSGS